MLKHFVALLTLAGLAQGCRCSPSEESLPTSRSADPLALRASCPPLPSWAGKQVDDIEADLLHANETHGTGYRLFKDGHLETYDDYDLIKNDAGRLKLERVAGSWRNRGPVDPAGIAALRKTVADADASEMTGARSAKAGGKDSRSHFLLLRDNARTSFCYLGDLAPAGIDAIEKAMHNLVKYTGDSAAPLK